MKKLLYPYYQRIGLIVFPLLLMALCQLLLLGCENKVDKFLQDLKSPNIQTRAAAADSLGRLGKKRAVEPLANALADRHWEVQDAAEESLVKLGAASVKSLIPVLRHTKSEARRRAAETLGRIKDVHAVEPLIASLRDPEIEVRKAVIEALGRIGDHRATESLIDAFQNSDTQVQDKVVEALVRIGVDAVPSLIASLENKQKSYRNRVAEALGKISDKRAVDPLVIAIKDEDKDVRWRSIEALGKIRDVRAVEPLIAALDNETGWLRKEIAWSLGEIKDPRAVDILLAELRNQKSEARWRAAESLGKIGDTRAIPALVSSLRDWPINSTVADALEKIGWEPQSIEDKVHVWVAKKDKKSLVRSWDKTKQVLLLDLRSDESRVIENALYAFVCIGKDEISQDLVNTLYSHGTRNMAQAYANCGLETLSVLAKDWAYKNGHKVWGTGEPAPVRWGEW